VPELPDITVDVECLQLGKDWPRDLYDLEEAEA
jgi:hypothetical protein